MTTPPADPAPLDISVGLVSDTLAAGTPNQTLRLFLTNGSAASIPWTGGDGKFTVAPAIGSAAGALVTASVLKSCTLTQTMTVGGRSWTVTPTSAGWNLTPTGSVLLDTGSQGTVAFDIAGLAPANPGVTQVAVQYTGGTRYRQADVALPVAVLPSLPPSLSGFTATPPTVDLTKGETSVTLSWTARNANTLMLVGASYTGALPTGADSVTVQIEKTTNFTLVATGDLGQTVTQSLTVTATPAPSEILPQGSIALWSGSIATIPEGWQLCDGSAPGIPDLRDRFVLAAGDGQAALQTGNADTHTHCGTACWTTMSAGGHGHHISATTSGVGLSTSANLSVDVYSNGEHTHDLILKAGSTDTDTAGLRPAWISLGYIVKLT